MRKNNRINPVEKLILTRLGLRKVSDMEKLVKQSKRFYSQLEMMKIKQKGWFEKEEYTIMRLKDRVTGVFQIQFKTDIRTFFYF